MSLRGVGQFRVEHAVEGEQIDALVLQRHAHRADTPHIFGLPMCQFIDEEVK
jgi:hypothetical protein